MNERLQRTLVVAKRHGPFAIEAAVALSITVYLLTLNPVRSVSTGFLRAFVMGLVSFFRLVAVDTLGTLLVALFTLTKVTLMVAPSVRMWRHALRRRWPWLPLNLLFVVPVFPILLAGVTTWLTWLLFIGTVALGWWCAGHKRAWLRPVAFLPWIVVLNPLFTHAPFADQYWSKSMLAKCCRTNDGERPIGFRPELARARYFSVTKLNRDFLVVTGERKTSWWLRRQPGTDRYRLDKRSAIHGNLWEGCVWGDSLWFTKKGFIFRLRRLPDGQASHEELTEYPIPLRGEVDFIDAVCDIPNKRIIAGELLKGRLHVLTLADGKVRQRDLGLGVNVQLIRRADGMLVGIDVARLFVYDPDRNKIIETHAAGLNALGFDLCRLDQAVVVADMTGRVRLFELGKDGRYRFTRGAFFNAPRRVAFSPDCQVIGVTSGDDLTVSALRRKTLEHLKSYRVGPGLRDIIFTGRRQMVVTDACMATFLKVPE